MYQLIRLSRSRYSRASILSTLMMFEGKHIEHTHDAQGRAYWAHSQYLMASMSNILTIFEDKHIKYIYDYLYKYAQCVYLKSIVLNNSLLLDYLIIQLSVVYSVIATYYFVTNLYLDLRPLGDVWSIRGTDILVILSTLSEWVR